MRNVDERPAHQGGGGASARPLLASERGGFVDRHNLWTEEQYAAAGQMRRVVDEVGVEMVRFAFVDQHGVLRGKTITRSALSAAMRSGITVPSSLVLKDSSGSSAFPVFSADPGVGIKGFAGAGDMVLVPDPKTFRVLPWTRRTGSILCDVRFPDGTAVPFCSRSILRRSLAALEEQGYGLTVGAELEFHVFRADGTGLNPDQVGRPGAPGEAPGTYPTTRGAQLLHEESLDSTDELVQELYTGLTLMDLPLSSIELEFGPSQFEITMAPGDAAQVADDVVLCRSAIRQICRRLGLHATFMSRPAGAGTVSSGWHLHQSLRDQLTGANLFMAAEEGEAFSGTGRFYLGGLLAHAHAAAAFATPTVNGYKRYQPYSLAPDRVVWGRDNKGAMVRAVGGLGDPATRMENRSGEPAANPYLYIASQVISGMDGLNRGLEPGSPSEDPYSSAGSLLPRSLAEALDALELDEAFREGLGPQVLDWYVHLKRAEYARYLQHVSDWEQREYFSML